MSEDLENKLVALLQVMVSRLPEGKRIGAPVVQQLLRTKFAAVYPEDFVASHEDFISRTLEKMLAAKAGADATSGGDSSGAAANGAAEESSSDDSDSSSSDSGDDDEEGTEEGTEGGSEEGEEADSEDFDSDDDDDDDDDEEDEESAEGGADGGAPPRKKTRVELPDETAAAVAAMPVGERCRAMAEVLKALQYRVRPPADDEALDDYLHKYLVPEFTARKLDPQRFGRADLKRYKAQKEVELLMKDGADVSLDRRARAGRGFSHLDGQQAAQQAAHQSAFKTNKFMVDEE